MNDLSEKRRFAVLGGGLAGTFLTYRLIQAGQEVILIDDQAPNSASRVAAGLFNVITGRFGAKSWMADILLPFFKNFLHQPDVSEILPFIHHLPIYRPFKEIKEYNKWLGRSQNPEFKTLVKFLEKPILPQQLENPYGGIEVQGCGWTETGKLIETMQAIIASSSLFTHIKAHLPLQDIDPKKKQLTVDGATLEFDDLVLCAGYQLKNNPIWPTIPIIPNKGELLLIEAPDLELDFIFSRKIYLIPRPQQQFIVGSTYKNTFSSLSPTEEGKAEICLHLEKAIKVPYQILEQKAGIRPTTPDRRPILGTHPELDYVHTFTGLGTKGVLQAPYFSEVMTSYLLENKTLPSEVDITRFAKGN